MAYTDRARLMPGASGKTAHTDICRYVRKSVCVSVSMCVCSHVHVVPITVNWVNQLRTISGKMCRMWFQTSHVRSSVLPALRQLTLATRTHIYSLSLTHTHTNTHAHTDHPALCKTIGKPTCSASAEAGPRLRGGGGGFIHIQSYYGGPRWQ